MSADTMFLTLTRSIVYGILIWVHVYYVCVRHNVWTCQQTLCTRHNKVNVIWSFHLGTRLLCMCVSQYKKHVSRLFKVNCIWKC